MNQPYTGARIALESIARETLPISTQVRIFSSTRRQNMNRFQPRHASWGSVNRAYANGERVQNLSPVAWGALGLGVAALGAGGYYVWQKRQASQLAAATGIAANEDCTKLTVSDQDVSVAYFAAFVDTFVTQLGDTPVDSLILGAAYLEDVAPSCGVGVADQVIGGVDTWQKAAMVGGLAMVASGGLKEDGRMTPEEFNDQAEAIQAFLLENGVDDLTMVEDVFEMPDPGTPAGAGADGAGTIAGRVANRRRRGRTRPRGVKYRCCKKDYKGLCTDMRPCDSQETKLQCCGGPTMNTGRREPNLGLLGILGWGVLTMGIAGVAGAGFAWYRNRTLTEACLGDMQWLEADGSLSEAAESQLQVAIEEALADGAPTAVQAADAAIVKVSGNPECRLPNLIWGDLLRVRASTLAMAATIVALEDLSPGNVEGPGPEVTGLEADLECNKLFVRDTKLSRAYFGVFLDESPQLQAGVAVQPDTIVLGARFLQRVAPHCGVAVTADPEIQGVDTWQKAAMVGAFALVGAGELQTRGIFSDAAFGQETMRIGEWLRVNGVDDLNMIEEVVVEAADTGFSQEAVEKDEWGEPVTNDAVGSGTVGGENGGKWRVYRDNAGKYASDFYYVIWSTQTGEFSSVGGFDNEADAADAALADLTSKNAGIGQASSMDTSRIVRGRFPNPHGPGRSKLHRRAVSRRQNGQGR